MKKICVFTGSRAEYGLLFWMMKEIMNDPELKLQLLVSGTHLSPEFGNTYKIIQQDGFTIDKKIEILMSSDTPVGLTKSMGLGLISFSEALSELTPDLILILGDRHEAFVAAVAAMVNNIRIIHLHGGESTEGAIDEAIRHSITKMSHLHLTSTETYSKKVIQLGENPKTVFNVGAFGIENIKRLKLLSKNDLENKLGFKFNKKNLLVTFHPVTLEQNTAEHDFKQLIKVIDGLVNTHVIFTMPNADVGGLAIRKLMNQYVYNNSKKSITITSMGQLMYLSTMQYVDAVVGNSSSGIIEAPSFKIGTINIGDRQKGRIKAKSVIDCKPDRESIHNAIIKLYSKLFQSELCHTKNPYGNGFTSKKAIKIIKNFSTKNVLKKQFYNINFQI